MSRLDAAFAGRIGGFDLNVAFGAPARGITALFGPSGCGKTSVLRCLAGLTRLPGRLTLDGETWQDEPRFLPPHRRAVGYVFQEASLFPHLSVRRNLLYGAKRAQGPVVFGEEAAVELLGLGPLLDRAPDRLSGGERQRVAIGRALLSQPRLLLLDEPLAALDRGAKEEILPYLEAVHDAVTLPTIYVSHDVAEVARLADTMVLMAKGRTVAEGPIEDILERLDLGPATGRFEAGAILTGRVAGHDDAFALSFVDHHRQRLTLPRIDAAPGTEIRLRVRARDVSIALEKPVGISIRNALAGTVAEIAEELDTAFAETLIDIGGANLRARITRASVADLGLAPGKPVYALIKSITFERRSLLRGRRG